MVKMAHVRVEENKNGSNDVSIKLEDHSKDVRVHVIAHQFVPSLCIKPVRISFKDESSFSSCSCIRTLAKMSARLSFHSLCGKIYSCRIENYPMNLDMSSIGN
jgi:hypothetical protein